MGNGGVELVDVVLAFVGASILMVVVVLLSRKEREHDGAAIRVGGIVGLFIYRMARLFIPRGISRPEHRPLNHEELCKIRQAWQRESDEWLLKALREGIEEYPNEVRQIIIEEADKRRLLANDGGGTR